MLHLMLIIMDTMILRVIMYIISMTHNMQVLIMRLIIIWVTSIMVIMNLIMNMAMKVITFIMMSIIHGKQDILIWWGQSLIIHRYITQLLILLDLHNRMKGAQDSQLNLRDEFHL